ncbi:MAG: hypothetical protein AAGE01_03575 [Pseudomonadota bacterium]
MRWVLIMLLAGLVACGGDAPEEVQTTVDVADEDVARVFAAVADLTEAGVDAPALAAMARNTKLDTETEDRFAVRYAGAETELMIHVWREQTDGVHLYFTSPSADLIEAIDGLSARFERSDGAG